MTTDLTLGRPLVDVFADIRIDGVELVPGSDMDDADAYRFAVDLVRQGLYGEAVELLEPLAVRHPDRCVRELLARAYFMRAQLAKAEELFRGLVEDHPDDAFLREALARTVRRRSGHAEADAHDRVARALR
ncbi:MAG: tol-pal system YbgF family protein [Kineosporiaceae bacterium]